ncbi:protein jag [Chloroflexota bacterium]
MELSEEQKKMAEVAREVLERLLELLEVSASIEFSGGYFLKDGEEVEPTIALDIEDEDPGILIGRRGQTLASLQYIVRLIVERKTDLQSPIIVDVGGYRRRRCESLRAMAWRIAEQVRAGGTPFALEPMSAFDRRVIHLALADSPDIMTHSTDVGYLRKLVILPKDWSI